MPRGKRTSTVDPNETKAQKFVRLANIRVETALGAIERLGKLGTPAYERTPEQVERLHKSITAAADAMRRALEPGRAGGKSKREAVL